VKRILAAADELADPIESLATAWELERRVGRQPVATDAGDERDVQALVPPVVGNVQEGVRWPGNEPLSA
jgi:hypothetical protein